MSDQKGLDQSAAHDGAPTESHGEIERDTSGILPRLAKTLIHIPTTAGIAAAASLLLFIVLWEFLRADTLPAIPLYYFLPILLLGWFRGGRTTLLATIVAGLATPLTLAWKDLFGSYPPLFFIGRLATFLAVGWLSRGVFTLRLMLDFYYRGPAWRSVQIPRRVSARFVIVPSFEDAPLVRHRELSAEDITIVIQPGMAFGTASHPTTQMCLTMLETSIHAGDAVLDIGCGTGILSIAAAKMDAASVIAIDNDPEAERVARWNVSANGVADLVEVRLGSLDQARQGSGDQEDGQPEFNLIIANILTHVIIEMMEAGLATLLAEDGLMILSGIREGGMSRLEQTLGSEGFEITQTKSDRDWVAVAVRNSPSA